MNAIHVSIYGEVQGVGYRKWAKDTADKLKITGWARNASDGSVELFLQGQEDEINNILSLCWEGPNLADVEDVLTQDSIIDESITFFEVY